jgi:acyl carrier protein
MTAPEIRAVVLRLLGEIAPETDFSTVRSEIPLRDQLDLDSMDYLNLLVALDKELHVEIPEADYRKLATLDGLVAYLAAAVNVKGG